MNKVQKNRIYFWQTCILPAMYAEYINVFIFVLVPYYMYGTLL